MLALSKHCRSAHFNFRFRIVKTRWPGRPLLCPVYGGQNHGHKGTTLYRDEHLLIEKDIAKTEPFPDTSGINSTHALHFVTTSDKVLLTVSMKYLPWNTPSHVTFGTMNSAWGRVKIMVATATMAVMLMLCENFIVEGRAARDGRF